MYCPSRLLEAPHELAEGGGPSDQWGQQLARRPAPRRGDRGGPPAHSRGGANALRQSHRLCRRFNLQLLGQARPAGGVDLQGGGRVAQPQVDAHEAPVGLLRQRIEGQPARERGARLLQLPSGLLKGGEPLAEQLHAYLPLLLRGLHPLVKGGLLPQPEPVQERAAHQGESLLKLRNQGGALRLGGKRGEPLGRGVGLLHHRQVQLEGSPWVQAELVTFTDQMAVHGRGSVGVGEQCAQQGNRVAQGRATIVGRTVGPQEGRQLAAGVRAPFDRQVEQQGLGLAQGKGEAGAVVHHFGWAEHGQT